jgi:methylamine--corrinoid protein Co-methyltransferase
MVSSYLEILERARAGPQVSKDDWDLDYIVLPTKHLISKYQIDWNPNTLIPNDPGLADSIFAAALDLAANSGIYNISTGRVIQFDRDELEAGLAAMPQQLVMGKGSDARTLYARRAGDERLPLVWGGNPGAPTPEDIFLPMVMSWMQEPLVDLATCGSLTAIDGYPVQTGAPTEILAVRRELHQLREGLQRVGRPGMGLLAAQSAVSELGDLAASIPDCLRPCDAHLVAIFNELVIDQGNMSRAVNSLSYGMRNASLATVMVGGLAGDAPGAAVVQAASFMLANLVCRADYHLLHPIHIRHVATSTPGVMWVQSVVHQAFGRNAPCIIFSDIYPKSGAGTRELLYEVAANALVVTISGGHLEGVGSADGALPNSSGLEVRWMAEVGQAAARQGISMEEANRMVGALLDRYEHVFTQPGGNPGMPFDQVYDRDQLQPTPEWEELYQGVKTEVRKMGLVFHSTS